MDAARPSSLSLRNTLLVVAVIAIVGMIGIRLFYLPAESDASGETRLRSFLRRGLLAPTKLDPKFTDANGDLIADVPVDASKQIDPETLVFAVLGSDADKEGEIFAEFVKHLESKTGKKVELIVWTEKLEDQMQALAKGNLHLAAISTGGVTTAVNSGGAIPFAIMADANGKFGYAMELIVPAKSSITKLSELRGKTISFVSPYSHSGFKAPIAILWKEFDLQPGRDFHPSIEGGQEMVVKGIAAGKLTAGPVASDLLKRMIGQGEVDGNAVRSIYTSKTFPPACFVHAHQLKPELAKKVQSAFLEFPWKGTALEKAYAPAGQTRFVAINYKSDWEPVRSMEEDASKLLATEPTVAKK